MNPDPAVVAFAGFIGMTGVYLQRSFHQVP